MSDWAFGDHYLSLYIRVESSFYTHRKTLRLKAIIGEAAFWVPPRLWSYAAGHQPDGCFKDYSAEELAMLIGYLGDAQALLQALLKAGFMDEKPLRIHDWHEYNGILDFFSKRAKKAADARWEKERSKEKEQIKADQSKAKQSRSEASIASSIASSIKPHKKDASLSLSEVFEEWNQTADNTKLPKCLQVSDKRRRLLEARLLEPFFLQNWRAALARLKSSDFCKGRSERGWKATFDWFIQPDSVIKIMEGKYDNRDRAHLPHNKRNDGVARAGIDYGEAARRKVERQVAPTANPPPQAQGNGA